VNLGPFAQKVAAILEHEKYDRSTWGVVRGYGIKHLP
jgi:hypothetical protein